MGNPVFPCPKLDPWAAGGEAASWSLGQWFKRQSFLSRRKGLSHWVELHQSRRSGSVGSIYVFLGGTRSLCYHRSTTIICRTHDYHVSGQGLRGGPIFSLLLK
ncbi:hypothetical protein YC2023_045971 [Brassica napus]